MRRSCASRCRTAGCSALAMRRRPNLSNRRLLRSRPGVSTRAAQRTRRGATAMRLARVVVMIATAFALALLVAPIGAMQSGKAQASPMAPAFEVDPFWPKPLPNHWVLGSTIGVSVDAQDHVWILHRPGSGDENFKGADAKPPIGACCKVAPPVLEFDSQGSLISSWGGPGSGYEWPVNNHGLTVDSQGNVWIGGNDDTDTQILKFTNAGKFLLQVGKHGVHNG